MTDRARLRLHDTAAGAVRDFVPLREGHVSIYLCGATVQGQPHIGHVRSGVAFDILRRWLIARGYDVEARVRTTAQTGVEMEALTAVAVAALTIYDMVKAVDKRMVIGQIRLMKKTGGKSGTFVRKRRVIQN